MAPMTRTSFALGLALSLPLAAGCGSSGFEIKHTLNEDKLAPVPMDALQPVLDAEAQIAKTRLLVGQARFAADDASKEIKNAQLEQQKSDLEVQSAQNDMDRAKGLSDQNRIASAQKELDLARAEKREADAKITYFSAKVDYEQAAVIATQAQVVYDEALLELTKAQIADSHGIRPDGFSLADFKDQAEQGKDYYNSHAQAAQENYQKVADAQKEFQSAEAAYDQARGAVATSSGLQAMPAGGSSATDDATPPPPAGGNGGGKIVVPVSGSQP